MVAMTRRSEVIEYNDVLPPGLESADNTIYGLEYFEGRMGYEVRYQAQIECELKDDEDTGAVQIGKRNTLPDLWRRIENAGAVYWYNETQQFSQWEAPPHVELRGTEVVVAAPNDYDALIKSTRGDKNICRVLDHGIILRVIVKPAQNEAQVLDLSPACAFISVLAPIEDGWCNQAVLAFLRRALHIPQRERNNVKITQGENSLDKYVFIPSLSAKEIIKNLHKSKNSNNITLDAHTDVNAWIRLTEKKQRDEERRLKRRKWA